MGQQGADAGDLQLLRSQEAIDYIRERYGIEITKPTLHRYCRIGKLRGVQPGGAQSWWLISRRSIDELFQP